MSLKNFTENIVGLVGSWRSPGDKSKQFVSNDLDLTMTWHDPGKQNSLLFGGKDGESLRDKSLLMPGRGPEEIFMNSKNFSFPLFF
jgi:hypothetical protein